MEYVCQKTKNQINNLALIFLSGFLMGLTAKIPTV